MEPTEQEAEVQEAHAAKDAAPHAVPEAAHAAPHAVPEAAHAAPHAAPAPEPKRRGRPLGSKNKPKQDVPTEPAAPKSKPKPLPLETPAEAPAKRAAARPAHAGEAVRL